MSRGKDDVDGVDMSRMCLLICDDTSQEVKPVSRELGCFKELGSGFCSVLRDCEAPILLAVHRFGCGPLGWSS
jgi:hypothetical protein